MSDKETSAARPDSALGRGARAFERAAATASRFAMWAASAACLSTLGVVCYAVAMRYFFNRPQPWSDEAAGWLVVVTVMLAAPEAQRRFEHIGVDVATEKLVGARRRVAAAASVVAVLVSAVVMLDEGLEMVAFTRMVGIVSIALPEIPLWAIQALVPAGAALLLLVALAQLACYAAGLEPRGPESKQQDTHE